VADELPAERCGRGVIAFLEVGEPLFHVVEVGSRQRR
jgi:hypothetical protein